MAVKTRQVDEKGNTLSSPVDYTRVCRWCNTEFACRREGRPPQWCSAECRKRERAAEHELQQASDGARWALSRLQRAQHDFHTHDGNLAADECPCTRCTT